MSAAVYAVDVRIGKADFTSVCDVSETSNEILYLILVFWIIFQRLKGEEVV